MFNSDLFCNYKKCHKLLTTFAWVTSCSHVFCEEHGNKAFEQDKKCPACGLDLCKDYDVVKTNLNPSEEFKSMVLAGLKPEIVLDMTTRSLSFWGYQMAQDKDYHMMMEKHWKERSVELESSYQILMVKMKNDREVDSKKFESLQTEFEILTKRNKELEEKLCEKQRLIQTIKSKYEALRRSSTVDESLNCLTRVADPESFLQFRTRNKPSCDETSKHKEFYFQPINTLPDN